MPFRRCFGMIAMAGGLIGCHPPPEPAVRPSGVWRVEGVGLAPQASPAEPGRTPPRVMLGLAGDPGYARATVVVERSGPYSAPPHELHDSLFPVGREAKFTATWAPAPGPAGTTRITIRAESAGAVSESVVEPGGVVPGEAFAPQVELLTRPGAALTDGREVEIARWTVKAGDTLYRVTFRLLPSREPTGPRLKPAGRVPL